MIQIKLPVKKKADPMLYHVDSLVEAFQKRDIPRTYEGDGRLYSIRPHHPRGQFGLRTRLWLAWMVFKGEFDVLRWYTWTE